jgi:hypothetical protein
MKYLWLLFFSATSFFAYSQNAQEKFGKNRIQHKSFEWSYYSSNNFDIYYYQGGQHLALEATKYLESQFDRLTDVIGYHPYSKAKILIYNSTGDLEQSNIGLNNNPFALGGETEFTKPLIEVAFPGIMSDFKDELLNKLSTMLINEMMFGGSLKDMFQSSMLMNLPEWFIRGAAKYVAEGWSKDMDDYIRQLVDKKKIQLNRLHGEEAALAGQSMWNFIAEKYGRSNISNILNYTRIIRNEEKSIAITLGLSFDRAVKEWRQYYKKLDEEVEKTYDTPADSLQIKKKKKYNLTAAKLSPEGTRVAYVLNEIGRYSIIIREVATGKEFEAMSGGYKRYDQEVNYQMPLISWADENTLGVIGQKNNEVIFWLYDVYTKSNISRPLRKIDQVVGFSFNSNGRLAILSAYSNGQNDLFLIATRRDRVRRLFTDPYDDIDPVFMPNSNVIVFSSNRVTDTLATDNLTLAETPDNFNIFAYHLDTTNQVLRRITNTVSRDVQPLASPDENVYFLSDQKGIVNLYTIDISTNIFKQVTNYDVSIIDYDIHFEKDLFAAIMPVQGENQLFLDHDFNLNREIFTPTTPRKQLMQVRDFQKRKVERTTEGKSFKEIINNRLEAQQEKPDTTATEISEDNENINTDDYQFEEDALNEVSNSNTILERYRKRSRDVNIKGPFPYETRFSVDYLVTSFLFDPLKGFSLLLEAEMTDMMENHRFSGNLMTNPDFRSGEISLEYAYLKQIIDFHGRFERETLFWQRNVLQQYERNTFIAGASIPFNVKTRLSISPFFANTIFEDLGSSYPSSPPTFRPSIRREYLGARVEFVYDNSESTGLNIISGTRGKASLRHWEGLDNKNASFSRLQIDIRNYQPIYKEIVFSLRAFYGRFFGNSPKKYALGGMDNWILSQENREGINNPLATTEAENQDLLFLEFATPLRGFNYATLYGTDAALLNLELRVPIVRALSNGPISSNFFRNLQFIGFYDIGSSWTGKPPFDATNTISAKKIREGSFEIDIKDYRNPWLSSYGVGMRTVLFGYYAKFDLAWPIEDYTVGDPKFFITLGYDF